MPRESKTATMWVRVTDTTRTKFIDKATRYGLPSEVLRELIEAFIEDRLKIEQRTATQWKELLYVPREQD